jgi:hypothetical protein
MAYFLFSVMILASGGAFLEGISPLAAFKDDGVPAEAKG